jgi:hypothetical protein
MVSVGIYLDRIESNGLVVATNNGDAFPIGTIFTELVKVRVEGGTELSLRNTTELWSTGIHILVVEAIIFRKPVELVPRGWGVGLRLEGLGIDEVADALEGKANGEFVHLRASYLN